MLPFSLRHSTHEDPNSTFHKIGVRDRGRVRNRDRTETEQRQSHVSRISVASPSHLWRMSLSCRLYLCRISVAPLHTLPSGPHVGVIKGTTQRTPPLPHRPHLGSIQALTMQRTKSDRRRNYNHFANVVVVVVS